MSPELLDFIEQMRPDALKLAARIKANLKDTPESEIVERLMIIFSRKPNALGMLSVVLVIALKEEIESK